MQKTRKLISMLLAVMMVLSMCTIGMMSASALPEGAVINDVEGNDASGIDGEVFGLLGDADLNEKINVKDATEIQKYAAKLVTLDDTALVLADVDLNDKVNVKDATAIQKWIAKIPVDMPINCLVYIPEATAPTTIVTEPTSVATTAATDDEPKPSVPVVIIPTTAVVDPTEATEPTTATEPTQATNATEATEPTQATTASTATEPAGDEVTVYFQNNWMWSDVSVHMWTANGDVTTWPGSAMTFVENDGTYDIYSVVVPDDVVGMLFNGIKDDGTGTLDQTPDILDWHNGQCFYNVWDSSLNEGAGGNNVGSFEYVVPTQPTTAETQPTSTATDDETEPTSQATDPVDDGMITIYFVKPENWEGAYLYSYYGDGKNMETEWSAAYPGNAMDFVETDANGNDIYASDVPEDINTIKFADGSSTNRRTDIIVDFYDGVCFEVSDEYETNKWYVEEYNYVPGGEATDATEPSSEATDPAEDMVTIYFAKPNDWANAFLYGFYGKEGESSEGDWPAEYPGAAMTFVEIDRNGKEIYTMDVPADIDYIKFNDGTGTDSSVLRTNNVPNDKIADGTCYQLGAPAGTNKWDAATYDYVPVEPTTEATEPTTVETEPTTVETEPTTVETEPTTVETEPTTVETEPTTVETEPTTVETEPTTAETEPTTEADDGMITIYFVKPENWEGAYLYSYYGEGTKMDVEWSAAYPGNAMGFVETDANGNDIYASDVPADINTIKFADGSSANRRTDIIVDFYDGVCYELGASAGTNKWYVEEYDYTPGEETTDATEPSSEATEPSSEATEPSSEATEPSTPDVEPEGITVYCVNSANWAELAAHAWDNGGSGTTWPGVAMTKTGETVNGFDVYKVTFDVEYDNIIFNNNNNGSQTDNLIFNVGKYFDVKSAAWYDSLSDVPAPSKTAANVFLAGEFNSWSTTKNEFTFNAEGDTVCYLEMDLAANTSYQFKVVTGTDWRGLKDTETITDSVSGIVCSRSVAGNTTITTKAAGKYIFAFDTVAYTLSVTYPG